MTRRTLRRQSGRSGCCWSTRSSRQTWTLMQRSRPRGRWEDDDPRHLPRPPHLPPRRLTDRGADQSGAAVGDRMLLPLLYLFALTATIEEFVGQWREARRQRRAAQEIR